MKISITIEVDKLQNSCFVAMPFNPLFKTEYENIIQPAIKELGLECIRGDEIYSQQRIMDDIWASLRCCRMVVAELTGRNPNVLYEIGLAHAIGKPVIILTRDANDVPFDLKDLRYLFYDINDPHWGENLKKGLQNLIEKVLGNSEIGNYLHGITRIETNSFPKLNKDTQIELEPKFIDISGIWKTSFNSSEGDIKIKHDLILTISQKKDKISCSGIITYSFDGNLTVVQEIFDGKITESAGSINGVNYSFIERGDSQDYQLDSFEFTSISTNKIKANHVDSIGTKNDNIEFIKFQ